MLEGALIGIKIVLEYEQDDMFRKSNDTTTYISASSTL
jgi:hypothetical protein